MRGNQNFSGAMGQNGARFARGGNAVSGEILTKDDKSITIKLRDGGSRIAFMGQTTQILKSSAGTFADISVGAQVSVVGTQNSDGSMIAQSVQLRPSLPSDSPASSTANQ